MDIARLIRLLIDEVLSELPSTEVILLWGGVLGEPRDALHYGDVDVLIVCPLDPDDPEGERSMMRSLTSLAARFQQDHGLRLDPAAISPRRLAQEPLSLVLESGRHGANSVVQYLIKHESRVIYGDAAVLDAIPEIELRDALIRLSAVVLMRVDAMVAELQAPDNGEGATDISHTVSPIAFATKHLSSLLVFARSIFSLREGRIASKVEALGYVAAQYPGHARLMRLLAALYKGESQASTIGGYVQSDSTSDRERLTLDDMLRYLDLVKHLVNRETRTQ